MLPVIIISTEIAVRNVPNSLREAGLALGAKPHKVSLKVVLPSAITGIVTGAILAISRAVGETAPVLLVIGGGFTNCVAALPSGLGDAAGDFRERQVRVAEPASPGLGDCVSPGHLRFYIKPYRPDLGLEKAAG